MQVSVAGACPQNSVDEEERHFAKPGVTIPAKSGLPSFKSDMWVCIPLPLSPKSGLGMNVTVLLCFLATFRMMYL